MKTAFAILAALCAFPNWTSAQIIDQITPSDTPYAVGPKGANQQVWQKTTYETLPSGQTVSHVHQYTELATGLHYWSNGQWLDSKEEIDILPNGTAAATNGQHQVYFPGDIYQGVIELVTPDGAHLLSRPLGLSYDDGTNTVLIAELTNSVGYLVGSNQVIYPNAFMDFQADLRYTYTKAGFEQDVIIRASPLTPESYGLNPETARLQVLTEFFDPPQPTVTTTVLPEQAGIALTDENLNFGVMAMTPGRAFLLGSDAHEGGALVGKSWVMLEGRQFLVEEVPVEALANQLAQLPVPQTASAKPNINSGLHVVSAKRLLPAPRLAETSPTGQFKRVAQAAALPLGLVLDYVTMTAQTNYTFQGDSTYYISGTVNLSRTNTFEGGAVLKYASNAVLTLTAGSFPIKINWQASAYRPVIFTAKDDNTVGEIITGSTGNPTSYYANPALQITGPSTTTTISYFRIAYARQAVSLTGSSYNFYHGQIVNCQNGITFNGLNSVYLRNVLFSSVQTNLNNLFAGSIDVQNSTFSSSSNLTAIKDTAFQTVYVNFTNCVFANVLHLTNNYSSSPLTFQLYGDHNGFYNTPEIWGNPSTNNGYPFQTAGAGNYYLTNGCGFLTNGANNIDPTLLASLKQKTTFSPVVCSNVTISVNTNFIPQVQRDTNSNPSLGYHYDPIDYLVDWYSITNAALTVTNGTAIATYNEAGFLLQEGSTITSTGSPLAPNWFVRYSSVQEQPISLKGTNSGAIAVLPSYTSTMPSAQYRFTKFACPAGGGIHLYDYVASSYSNLLVQDCEFWSGANTLGGTNGAMLTLRNNLFARSVINASGNGSLSLSNSLAWGVSSVQLNPSSTNAWNAFNNDFDSCTIASTNLTNGYNAYLNCSGRLYPTNAYDVVSNLSLSYQTGFLGVFYQPTNSSLIDVGSANASLVGLYHYTTQTNQVKETNSVVDIGYHYVATDTNGIPVDSNGDGIPDYWQDFNGNGLVDNGETNWGLAILTQPVSQTVLVGDNSTISVSAAGLLPLNYQWWFNSSSMAGQTNYSLNLTNVATANAGNYFVVVTNSFGSITSQLATLSVSNMLFFEGINLGGPAVVVEGNQWSSYSYALTNGFSVTNAYAALSNIFTGSIAIANLAPATDLNTSNMLQTFIRSYRMPPLPLQTTNTFTYAFGSSSFKLVTLSGVQPGYLVTNGVAYPGWEVINGNLSDYGPYACTNFYSYELADVFLRGTNLNMVNYIVNHKSNYDVCDLQLAIEKLTGAGDPDTNWYHTTFGCIPVPANYTNIMNDARTNGASFIPGTGQIATVIVDPGLNLPPMALEVPVAPIGFIMSQVVTNGCYNVYLWLAENESTNLRSLNVKVQGITVATNIGTQPLGNWVKLGPYGGNVTNGVLTIEVDSPAQGDPMLMGLAIYRCQTTSSVLSVMIANPTNNQLFAASPLNISLTATASDSVGTVTNVQFFNGTNLLGSGTSTNSSTWALLWIDAVAGNYTITAKAFDNLGNTATNSVSITVNARPMVYITTPTNLQSFLEITDVTLQAVAYDPNAGGSITGVGFYDAGTNLPFTVAQSGTNFSLTWSNLHAGVHPITAVATNNYGAVTWSSITIFKVNSTNLPPAVVITNPTNSTAFADGSDITITATASALATNASVTNVEFFVNGQDVGNCQTNPYCISKCCWQPGTYQIMAVATDNFGGNSISSNVQITVVQESLAGFWDTGFHPTNSWSADPMITADECGSYVALSECLSTTVYGSNLYIAALERVPASNNPAFNWDMYYYALYKWNGTNWFRWGAQSDYFHDHAYAPCHDLPFDSVGGIAVNDSGLYVAGFDTNAEYIYDIRDQNYVVQRWNGTNWIQLGNSFTVASYGMTNTFPIRSEPEDNVGNDQPRLQFVGSDLYIFGDLISGTNIQYIAKLNTNSLTWEPVGSPLNAPVMAVANWCGKVVVGGFFTAAGGNTNANRIAELVNGQWSNLGAGIGGLDHSPYFTNGYNTAVYSLAVCNSNLFAGGNFTSAGSMTNASGIAVWNGSDWKNIGGGLICLQGDEAIFPLSQNQSIGMGNYLNPMVHSISTHGNVIYIGGQFTDCLNTDGTDVRASSVAKAVWNENAQQWVWSDLYGGLYYLDGNFSDGVKFSDTVLTTAIMTGPTPDTYDVVVGSGGWLDFAGPFYQIFWQVARWRVGYPPPPSLPSVTITNPVSGSIVVNDPANPTNITVNATAFSGYTNIAQVSFYADGLLIGTDSSQGTTAFSRSWAGQETGPHVLVAVATDGAGLVGNSQPVIVSFKNPTNTITAVDDQYSIPENIPAVTLKVLTNDIPTAGLKISQITQLHFNLGTATVGYGGKYITYTPAPNAYGTDIFYYSVTNASNALDSASVTVKILAPPHAEITSPLDRQRIAVPVSPLVVTGLVSSLNTGIVITNVTLNIISASNIQSVSQVPVNGRFGFSWTNSVPGFYTFVAVAADGIGTTNASTPVTIALYNSNAPSHTVTAAISNLIASVTSQNDATIQADPVITNGIFDLQGRAADSVVTNPVSYQVLLYKPNASIPEATDDPNIQATMYLWDPPFANVTPGPLNAQGFHIGGDTNGDLGMLDLTGLANGVYEILLNVRGGADETNALVEVQLNSQLKVGQFSFSEQDLALPVNGMPITITRTYNSLNPLSGDFGYSWTFAINSMDVQLAEQREDVTLGSARAPWAFDDGDGTGLPVILNVRTGGSWDVTLTLPDGRRTTFQSYFDFGVAGCSPKWKAPLGVNYTLTTTDNSYYDGVGHCWNNTWNFAFNNYDLSGYLLLDNNSGTKYFLTRGEPNDIYFDTTSNGDGNFVNAQVYGPPKLTRIILRSGDGFTIDDNGIAHYAAGPNGTTSTNLTRSVSIKRDTQGRIAAIYDPNGGTNGLPAIQYIYNQSTGNLLQALKLVDRTAGTYTANKYHYDNPDFPHLITSIENGDGVPVARNYYDDSGKLTAVQDADGNLTQFIHNAANNMEVVIDRLGHTNTFVYDLNGNVIAQTNALGQVSTMAYDASNNKTNSVVYLNGQPYATSSYVYDGNNLLLASTDPLGHTNGFTYDGYGNVLISADAKGNTTANVYDPNSGTLTSTTDALGHGTTNSYNNGLLTGSVDAEGTVTTNYYNNYGNLTASATLSSGTILSSNTFAYDLNGNRTNSTIWRRANSSWVGATTTFTYDGQNRVTQTIDPDGGTNTVVYDLAGKQVATIDKRGYPTSYTYDGQGRLIQTQYPDSTTETNGYDANGNRFASADRLNRITTYYYDALNRLTNTTYVDGATSMTIYDGVGRVAQAIDARGAVTAFNYDAAGRRVAVTNAWGLSIQAVSSYGYDANGNQIYFTNALGFVTTNIFDALNRQVQTLFSDGTKTGTSYDAAGRRAAETNQDGIVTQFGYDGACRLTSVTNALNQVTRYQYDEAGNEIVQIDALNRTNVYFYDGLGRRIQHVMPGGQTEGFGYDSAGNLIYQTNFNGTIITNQYDVMNRLTNQASTGGYSVRFAYSATGQRTNMIDPSGTTAYFYNNRDRLLLKTNSWTGGPSISLNYLYDANGNVTNIWSSTANGANLVYNYDPLSRLTNVLANGNAAAGYGYDLAGNLQTMRYGNGVTNLCQYDSLNRLTNSVWKLNAGALASFYYQLGQTGNRTNVTESVNSSARTNVWYYDALYRLTNEIIGGASYASAQSLGYSYDPVGNRTIRTNISGSLSLTNQSFIFNTNDWLITDQYDANGNTTNASENAYQYDALNHVTNVNSGTVLITYDGDGNRVKKTVGSTTTTYYLVDDRNPSGYAQVLEEWTSTGTPSLSKVYNYGMSLVSQRTLGSQLSTNYFVYDGHGSTRALYDTGGTFLNAFAYDAYGNLIASNSITIPQTVYLYAGQQFDTNLGVYYLRARVDNPNTGRFLTSDSYSGNNEDPLSLHKYLYCQGNPVDNVDPSGNDIEGLLDVMDMSGMLDGIGIPIASQVHNRALQLGGIDVDVYIWKWKGLGFVFPHDSVGHVMVTDDGTHTVEVSQFPHLPGESSTMKGKNRRWDYDDTLNYEGGNPDTKFLVHLPNPSAFHAAVQKEVARYWWVWDPHGSDQTQCARAGYDVLKAGGLPLWGYGAQGEIMPGWLSVKLNQFANFNNPNNNYSVERIQ